jgi:F-type H+-transporting ATPase subunit delta
VCAAPVDGLKERLELLFHERTGADIQLEEKINPDILGGFIFEMDGYRLDASVETQFRMIRRQLIEKNNRIV